MLPGAVPLAIKRDIAERIDGFPESSWWVGLSREQFTARASGELERMRRSRYGMADVLTTGIDVTPVRREKDKKREEL